MKNEHPNSPEVWLLILGGELRFARLNSLFYLCLTTEPHHSVTVAISVARMVALWLPVSKKGFREGLKYFHYIFLLLCTSPPSAQSSSPEQSQIPIFSFQELELCFFFTLFYVL